MNNNLPDDEIRLAFFGELPILAITSGLAHWSVHFPHRRHLFSKVQS